jgi:formylmethanofuran dehydrogenase subunit E
MDDNSKQAADSLVECPSCHHKVPERDIVAIVGRRLCLGCAGAWSDDEDEDE